MPVHYFSEGVVQLAEMVVESKLFTVQQALYFAVSIHVRPVVADAALSHTPCHPCSLVPHQAMLILLTRLPWSHKLSCCSLLESFQQPIGIRKPFQSVSKMVCNCLAQDLDRRYSPKSVQIVF